MNNQAGTIFLAIFPIFFIAMWLAITLLIGLMSGWFTLQKQFPDNDEPALLTLRGQSGMMGKRVGLNGILTLGACPSGLRIGVWRMFGLFQRPFLVPWGEITAESKSLFLAPMARLSFGHPEIGSLTVDAWAWQRLSGHSPAAARRSDAFEPVSKEQMGRALLLQWAIMSAAITLFLALATQLQPDHVPVPAVIFAFPAILFGVAQLIRYVRMRP